MPVERRPFELLRNIQRGVVDGSSGLNTRNWKFYDEMEPSLARSWLQADVSILLVPIGQNFFGESQASKTKVLDLRMCSVRFFTQHGSYHTLTRGT
jgi:hypothetical protein